MNIRSVAANGNRGSILRWFGIGRGGVEEQVEQEATGRREPLGIVFWLCTTWLFVLTFSAVFAHLLPLIDPLGSDFTMVKTTSDATYWLGTDALGRDIFSRIVFGGRVSLTVGFFAPLIGMTIGMSLGMLAGYFRGKVESFVVGTMDVILAFPNIVLAMSVLFFVGANLTNLVLVIAFYTLPQNTRIARATTLVYTQREFVVAARAQGASHLRILLRELLPNVLITQVAYVMLLMAFAIGLEGGLGFLGVGIRPPTPTWGGDIAKGFEDITTEPHITFMPAFVMFLTILSLNLIGDRMRKFSDSRSSSL